MSVIIYLSLILCLKLPYAKSQNVDIPLMELDLKSWYGRWIVLLSIQSQHQMIEKINQELDYTWLKDDLNTDKLNLIRKGLVYYYSREITSNYYKEVLSINNTQTNETNQLQNYYFHYAKVKSFDIANGGVGFAFKFKDYNNSIIHQLHKEGMITKLIYSLVPHFDSSINKD